MSKLIISISIIIILFIYLYNNIENFSCCNDNLAHRKKNENKDNKVKVIS